MLLIPSYSLPATTEQSAGHSEPDANSLPLYKELWLFGQQAYKQYETRGDGKVLEFAIQSFRLAMEAAEDDNPDEAAIIANLGDLEESISLKQLANALTPDDSPDKHRLLSNLAASLISRFHREGRAEDLEEANALWTRAVELVPDGHVSKPMLLNNFSASLQMRFERSGSMDDLEKAIELQTRAAELTPEDHPNKPMRLDLEMAIALQSRSVDLTPDGHPDKPAILNSAGGSLQTRFTRLGDFADLERAIVLYTRAVELTSDGHPEKPMQLNNLANSLRDRYQRTRDAKDLEEAIVHLTRAIQLSPTGHPHKPGWLNNLGTKLGTRFEQSGNLDDLDQAITHLTTAVTLTPEGHPEKPSWLYNLGNSLLDRFKRVGDVLDLEEAIKCSTRSVELTPENHVRRAQMLRSLGGLFFTRLCSPRAHVDDASCAMEALLEAIHHPTSPPLKRLHASSLYAYVLTDFSHLFTTPPRLSLLEAWKHAISLIPQCLWLGNNVRGRYTSKELQEVAYNVGNAVTAAISAGEYGLALEWLETGRAVVWSQVLQLRTPLDDLQRLHPQLAEHLRHVSQALELAASGSSPVSTKSQLTPLSLDTQPQSSHGYALEYDKLISTIRELKGFEDFLRPKTLSQLAGAYTSGPVVVINVHKSRCDALVLYYPGQVKHVPLPSFSSSLASRLHKDLWSILTTNGLRGRFRDAASYEDDDRGMNKPGNGGEHDPMFTILADLWNLVVKPILDVILTLPTVASSSGLPHITWCPTGPLAFLPLHAAGIYRGQESSRKTIMDFVVSSYTPTLEALLKPRVQIDSCNDTDIYPRGLVVSQPATPGCSPIPKTTMEAGIVMSLIGISTTTLHDSDGTVEAVLSGMETNTWVHLACHGRQVENDPMNSSFFLHNGKLTLSTLMSKHLPDADLAVLSACQTATGDAELSEEAVHLAAEMLNVGYKSVIGTMWTIYDNCAPVVMETFYRVMMAQVKAGGELQPAYALHEATKALRKECGDTSFIFYVLFSYYAFVFTVLSLSRSIPSRFNYSLVHFSFKLLHLYNSMPLLPPRLVDVVALDGEPARTHYRG
ncbi:CHAT domain-containing protein [Irpex rosettiformis]|uniref:CHAT domain-containing protein n=1 Tax=Irpex rosettiformis TaxID=378272 RepID=A0ACB8TNC1_9APHY|nr:CHAT domain-containing protein [Irpex rosettiformis]